MPGAHSNLRSSGFMMTTLLSVTGTFEQPRAVSFWPIFLDLDHALVRAWFRSPLLCCTPKIKTTRPSQMLSDDKRRLHF